MKISRLKARVTIREVARSAGVSVATVSRVFNNSDLVVKQTEEKIRSVARRLNYIPNASARSLSMKRTETIGMLLPDMYGEFFPEIIRGADAVARKERYHLLVSSSHSNREELETAIKLMSGRVDGFILMSPHFDDKSILMKFIQSIPTVFLSTTPALSNTDAITIDNVGGAKLATRHLIDRGHHRIAIVKGCDENADAKERFQGFLSAMKSGGESLREEYVLSGDFTERSGFAAAEKLLALSSRPTAVFASNDEMAIGVLRHLRERGVSVPDEIAVAGFDDIQISSLIHPSLTSIHVNISELGSLAVERLLFLLNSTAQQTPRKRIVLPATLIVRESTAARNSLP